MHDTSDLSTTITGKPNLRMALLLSFGRCCKEPDYIRNELKGEFGGGRWSESLEYGDVV